MLGKQQSSTICARTEIVTRALKMINPVWPRIVEQNYRCLRGEQDKEETESRMYCYRDRDSTHAQQQAGGIRTFT